MPGQRIAKHLRQHDQLDAHLPYADGFINHGIACGVFHFFGDLAPIIGQLQRVIRRGGVYAHSHSYVARCLDEVGFVVLKKLRFLVGDEEHHAEVSEHTAYVARALDLPGR